MNLYVLEVKFSFHGKEDAIYPVILKHNTETFLVDCGYQGFMPLIEKAASLQGISLQELTGIIITHHDMDHVGGLFELKEKYPSIQVYSSVTEEKYISGKEKSLRLVQAENMYPSLPDDQKPGALAFQEMLKTIRPVEVDNTFSGNADVTFRSGITIIQTPGHMPGHFSMYLPASKTLIAADAVVYEGGELDIANPHFTLDLPQAVASVKKLQQLDIDTIICYHGGVVNSGIQQKLSALISRYTHH